MIPDSRTPPPADEWESIRRQAEACRSWTPEEGVAAFAHLMRLVEAQLAAMPDGERARRMREPPHPSFFVLRDRLIAEQGLRERL